MADQDVSPDLRAAVEDCVRKCELIREQIARVVVGQEAAVDQVLIALIAGGHVLVEGSSGLGKSQLLVTLAEAVQLRFRRIHFTPDLTPADVVGAEVLREDPQTGLRGYAFQPGPLFANLIVAADIDRAPPKVQSALFGAMEERQVFIANEAHSLPVPFLVLASQNSSETEESSPLSEAQLDRFVLSITMNHLSGAEEWSMVRRLTSQRSEAVRSVLTGEDLIRQQQTAAQLGISDQVLGYAWALVRSTRPMESEAPEFVDRLVARGAGPRGLLGLVRCAKARAAMRGNCEVAVDDVEAMALPVLRHRVVGNFAAQSQNLSSDRLLGMIMESMPPDEQYEPPPAVSC